MPVARCGVGEVLAGITLCDVKAGFTRLAAAVLQLSLGNPCFPNSMHKNLLCWCKSWMVTSVPLA
jgi:hypothetical protein